MEDIKDKKGMKYLSTFVLACIVSTYNVFMGNTAGLPEYYGNIIGAFITFSVIVYVIEKIVPKKKEDEEDE